LERFTNLPLEPPIKRHSFGPHSGKGPHEIMKKSSLKPNDAQILTINGGSSSIKFALFRAGKPLVRGLYGKVDRIGLSGTNLTFIEPAKKRPQSHKLAAADHTSAAKALIDWLEYQNDYK